jgi:2,4-dienoyl-CoA reductase-like NADH-dependent reductase (Old Yellow Enzyme family)
MASNPGYEKYSNVFQPLKLGPVEVPNRIFMPPHGIPLDSTVDGFDIAQPAVERLHYFAERAAGGVGLIIHSTQAGAPRGQENVSENAIPTEFIPSYRRVAETVHAYNVPIFAEIWYVNWLFKRWGKLAPEAPALAPSALPNAFMPGTRREMTKREIKLMIQGFGTAARNLREAGYDGIELHVSHGSIVEYFLSTYFNFRTDEYGGSVENRARFLIESLEAIKAELSDEMALGMRITIDERLDQALPGALSEGDVKEAITHIVKQGLLDFADLDISVEPEQLDLMTTGMLEPVMWNAERIGRVREACGDLPVLGTPGRVTSIADCDRLIGEGKTDMVGIVRGLIAEPELVNKARDGRERERRICVAVNACVTLTAGWGCAINPAAGREELWGEVNRKPAPEQKRVVVVGGGPAGLEAARVAAQRGHEVTVLERSPRVGGLVTPWAKLPGREAMLSLPNYFSGRLTDLGVDVRTGVDADLDTVLDLNPDVVVVATGSKYRSDGLSGFIPKPLAGADRDIVISVDDAMSGQYAFSGKVVVLDDEGMHTGPGIAELAAAAGAEAIYVTRHHTVTSYIPMFIRAATIRLADAGVDIRTGTYIREVGDGSVTVFDVMTGKDEVIDGVTGVVLATARVGVDTLSEALEGKVPYVYLVGDALAPRSLRAATYEGHRFAFAIGEPDMPQSVIDEYFVPDRSTPRPASTADVPVVSAIV